MPLLTALHRSSRKKKRGQSGPALDLQEYDRYSSLLLSDKFYVDSDDDLLQATGKLFSNGVKAYIQPMSLADIRQHLKSVNIDPDWVDTTGDSDRVTMQNLSLRGPLMRLLQYIRESGFVEDLPDP